MHYTSSQENGLSAELTMRTLMKEQGEGPALQRTEMQLRYTSAISPLWDTGVLHLSNILGYFGIQTPSLCFGSERKENYFYGLEAIRHISNKSLISATETKTLRL